MLLKQVSNQSKFNRIIFEREIKNGVGVLPVFSFA